MIQHISFGEIVVNGKRFNSDVKITGDEAKDWWRKEGHRLCMEDITDMLASNPDHIVIGTGMDGIMEIPQDVIDAVEEREIEISVAKTEDAVDTFNTLIDEKKHVVGGFHITC